MVDPYDFAKKQSELTAEFAKYVLDHLEIDDSLPKYSYISFEVGGEREFYEYSRELALRRQSEEGMNIVCAWPCSATRFPAN